MNPYAFVNFKRPFPVPFNTEARCIKKEEQTVRAAEAG
jgi:hypothetical protein